MKREGIWITWENQIRNRGISSALGFELHELDYDEKPLLVRYFLCILQTIILVLRSRPCTVAVQNPSIILTCLSVALSKFFNFRLVVDAHNSGLIPAEGKVPLLLAVARLIQKQTPLTLVTNADLARMVHSNGGRAFVLPDRIPAVSIHNRMTLRPGRSVACICTFSADEPYLQILKAAEKVPQDITFYFTGNYKGKIDAHKVPQNVVVLGFLSREDYWGLLNSADVVMDLTLRENCLVCGAYEGVAVEKPMILSNTKALVDYFFKGSVYVGPKVDSIADGVTNALAHQDQLTLEIRELKTALENNWDKMLLDLKKTMVRDF